MRSPHNRKELKIERFKSSRQPENNSFSFDIFKKIWKIFPVVVYTTHGFILISNKFDIVTKCTVTVFTFWEVLNETYSSFNCNYALELIRTPEFGIAKLM